MSADNFVTGKSLPKKDIATFLFLSEQYQICKRKLDSKCEALLILTKDLDQCRQERDQFKLMAEQVQERYQALKRQLAGVVSKVELCINARRKEYSHQAKAGAKAKQSKEYTTNIKKIA